MAVLRDPQLEALLSALHERSETQLQEMQGYYERRSRGLKPNPGELREYLSNKMVALERDRAEFCYQLIRAKNARHVVEIGTSYGVSTLYLAAGVRDNIRTCGGTGLVTATEYESGKAALAREHFVQGTIERLH